MPLRLFNLLLALLLAAAGLASGTNPVGAAVDSRQYQQTGFSVADAGGLNFLTEFDCFGGVEALGYPISNPFVADGFTYQAFQRGLLQWRPEINAAMLANTLDWLGDAGKNPYLASLGIPAPLSDSGGEWTKVVAERESWLSEPAIERAYRNGGGYERFGLPASKPERAGPFVVQRFQRYAFQLWVEAVPGMPAMGSVVGILAGDLANDAGLIPASAKSLQTPGLICQSNPNSLVKGSAVDVVRARLVTVGWNKVALETTLRNNCQEERTIRFSARAAAAPGGRPLALGKEKQLDFGPGEEISFVYEWTREDGSYPAIPEGAALSFYINWRSSNSGDLHCLDVGAEKCLQTHPWLRTTVEQLAADEDGLRLLRIAANHGIDLLYEDLPEGYLGMYRPFFATITLDIDLALYSEQERCTILIHELVHAFDFFAGTPMLEQQACLEAEVRAFRTSAEYWYRIWSGELPTPPTNPVQHNLNIIAQTAREDPAKLNNLITERYMEVCGRMSDLSCTPQP